MRMVTFCPLVNWLAIGVDRIFRCRPKKNIRPASFTVHSPKEEYALQSRHLPRLFLPKRCFVEGAAEEPAFK